ncbi:DUF1569 domain-containing protein [Aquimarina sp. 2201CG5-10]|uniref:DUF1569 domain-containing protein n=1 Tax=Aquimarina callyspongiae TaxID=3098150 RepID=UPI002AB59687|nr:DUF1569 domain-containing protein [Aquimarina sp. 2201CG5-10]MDY8134025.1 DUF1569 domain-containing protein [Aquimarina sp. 2201CG5-10]
MNTMKRLFLTLSLRRNLTFIDSQERGNDKKEFMDSQLYDIAYLIQFRDSVNTKVSKAPIAWHLDHCLKVINRIHDILKSSDPKIYKKRFNSIRLFSFTFGYIPRGRGQAPAAVLPPDNIKTEDLLSQLEQARKNLKDLETMEKDSNFIHPVFGQLNIPQTKRFLKIHTQHHLKIVKDILKE